MKTVKINTSATFSGYNLHVPSGLSYSNYNFAYSGSDNFSSTISNGGGEITFKSKSTAGTYRFTVTAIKNGSRKP